MDTQSLADAISAVHTFPCRYTFKIIGNASEVTEESVRLVIWRIHAGAGFDLTCRSSSGARFASFTLEIDVPDVETVIQLYGELQTLSGLKMLL